MDDLGVPLFVETPIWFYDNPFFGKGWGQKLLFWAFYWSTYTVPIAEFLLAPPSFGILDTTTRCPPSLRIQKIDRRPVSYEPPVFLVEVGRKRQGGDLGSIYTFFKPRNKKNCNFNYFRYSWPIFAWHFRCQPWGILDYNLTTRLLWGECDSLTTWCGGMVAPLSFFLGIWFIYLTEYHLVASPLHHPAPQLPHDVFRGKTHEFDFSNVQLYWCV